MTEWWRGAVIYQIYPRSFCDSNGDGVGDIAGISSRLDYIASLGVDAIWISPFFRSPMRDFGYDVADFYDVDPIFGSLEDFDALVGEAHARNVRVIIDQVYSHTSDQCAWFEESRSSRDNNKSDWYVWADAKDDGGPPNNWNSVFWGSAWTWDDNRKQYYLHNFLAEQPDLNLHNPEVQEELLNIARFWLDRGVDGFRLDATNHFMHDPELRDDQPDAISVESGIRSESHPDTLAFIKKIRATMDTYPGRFSVAEIGGRIAHINSREYTAGESHFNTAYSFVFLGSNELSASKIVTALKGWDETTSSWPSWTFSNHDMPRVVTRWGEDNDPEHFAKTMQALLLTLRGTIFLYQGEELGLPQADIPFDRLQDPEAIENWPETLGRDGARSPLPWSTEGSDAAWHENSWLPVDKRHYSLSVAEQSRDQDSNLSFCKRLIAFRKKHPALVVGDTEFLESPDDVLAFIRAVNSESILCVFNLGRSDSNWEPRLDRREPSFEAAFTVGNFDADTPMNMPPLTGYVVPVTADPNK